MNKNKKRKKTTLSKSKMNKNILFEKKKKTEKIRIDIKQKKLDKKAKSKIIKLEKMEKEFDPYMTIQWFPGHMAKTRRLISEKLKLIDLVVEVVDARIPISSRNPEIDKWILDKERMIILNKADMSDDFFNKKWRDYYVSKGFHVVITDCKIGKGIPNFISAVEDIFRDKLLEKAKKGITGYKISVMILGVPNVGKSSFINKISNSKSTKVEDRPGVTRGLQWVVINKNLEMLDIPGVLWPKFEDKSVGEKLAFTGAVKDQILDIETLAVRFIEVLKEKYQDKIAIRYQLGDISTLDGYDILSLICKKRGMLISGGQVDTLRGAIALLDEYRSGKLGNITLDYLD